MRTRWTLAGLVCLCLVDITIGGAPRNHRETEDGKPCSFPFTVDGETHYDCTKYKWDHEWCATTPNFNKDKKWGNCKPRLSAAAGLVAPHSDPCSPPPNGKGLLAFAGSYNGNCSQWWQPCKIPFTFEGKTYYSCTSDGYRLNLNWCSLVDDWVTGQPWGICHDTKDRNDACPWVEVSGAVKDANTNGYYYRLNDICQTGYTAGTWRKCNLPSSNNDRFIQLSNTQNYLRWSISSSQCRDFPVAYSRDYRLTPPIPTQPYDPSIAPWYEWFNSVEYPNSNLKVTCLNSFEETCLCDRCACVTADSCQCTQSCSGGGSTCIDTFTKTNGMHSLGGKLYDGVTSQLQCESLCLVNDTCMAYDFDRNQQQCFFHIGMGYKSFQAASAGVDQYERIECTTTTGQPTGTTRPGACKDSFQPYPDMHGFGATDDATADTLAKCETACLNNPNCLAYEYDIVSTPSCWIHENAVNIDPLVDTDTKGVFTHYRRVKCTTTPAHPVSTPGGCQDTFDELASRFSFDGTELASANTLDECKQGCREDDNCVGCDWNIASNGCFLHYDKVEFAKKHDSRGAINQYVRKPCGITTGMTARTTGFPTGTGCVDTFHQLEKHNAPGGSRQNGVTTDHDCASECLKSATCVAYDYNWLDDDCYLFFDKVKADKTQYNTDVHHYTRQPCVGGGSTTPPGGCQDEFKEYLQYQTVGGEQYTGTATTVSDCLRACIQSDCYGIDWDQQNSAQPTCWLHRTDKNFLGRKPVNTNINSYELIHRCQDSTAVTGSGTTNVPTTDCPNAWQKMEDTKVNGAEKFPAATTVEQCQKACREQSDCKSIDFNTGSGVYDRCWLHTKEISSNDYQPASGVDHYKHIGCPQLKCIYHLYADTKVVGAEEQPSMALEACQESCTADPNCLALDFVPANSGCWLHSNLANLANRQNAAGVNHYVKECMEKCEDDFIGYENYNVQGGEQVSGVANLDACKTACSNNAACVAIDFNTITNSCWMHTDATTIQTRSVASGINHYVIQRCDEGCRSEWELYDNQNVQGGTKASGVNNLDDCKKYCDDMAECLGIDYNINDAGCWTHTDPNKLAARKSMNGVDHLVIKRCSECINNYERYNNTNAIGGTKKKKVPTATLR